MSSVADLPSYQHKPLKSLDHVRVLALQPASRFEAQLTASIIQYDRKNMHQSPLPIYEAVSYTWGEPVFPCAIIVDDATISTTENVDTMLRYFRKPRKVRYLWIDAICLDQANHLEKSTQIKRMGMIYSAAKRVNIWLGNSDDNTSLVFIYLTSIFYNADGLTDVPEHFPHPVPEALIAFLSRPWFSRRWVLQEAVLNPFTMVRCGSLSIPWPHLCDAICALDSSCGSTKARDRTEPPLSMLRLDSHSQDVMRILCRLRQSEKSMLSLLWDFHTSDCRDPIDRLGALYGLAGLSPGILEDIKVDGQRPWPELYTKFANEFLRQGKGLQLTSHIFAFGSLPSQMGCPSYVPNWSAPKIQRSYLHRILGSMQLNETRFNMGKAWCGLKEADEATVSTPRVGIHGVRLEVRQARNFRPTMNSNDEWLQFFGLVSINSNGFALPAEHHAEDESWKTDRTASAIERFLRLLFNGKFMREVEETSSARVVPTLLQLLSEDTSAETNQPDFEALSFWIANLGHEPKEKIPGVTHCLQALQNLLYEHSFFIVKELWADGKRLCGFGPSNLQTDDGLVLFEEFDNPPEGVSRSSPYVSVGCALHNGDSRVVGPCFFIQDTRIYYPRSSIDGYYEVM